MHTMGDDTLEDREVRLFPSHHITSEREAELRATAALLAITKAVSEFGKTLVALAGGPRGRVATYTEVPFKTGTGPDEKELRPDGLLCVTRGKREWRALLEVKVGDNPLGQEQFDLYHKLARDVEVDALITISNQAALPNGLPPLSVDGRRLRSVSVTHLSWERLLSEARVLSRREGVADEDQSWMLEEWVRYLADPASRIIEPPQLGKHWKTVLRAAREANLPAASLEVQDVVEHWDGFLRKVAMRLRAKLGADVQLVVSRAEKADPQSRLKKLHAEAIQSGELNGAFKIRDAAGPLFVSIILPARSVQYAVEVKPPTEGRQKTRVTWLTRQLKASDVAKELLVQVRWDKGRVESQARILEAMENPDALLRDSEHQPVPRDAMPRLYRLERTIRLPKGRGRSTVPVLEGIAVGLETFYRKVVENLRPFVPRAPRLSPEQEGVDGDANRPPTEEPGPQTITEPEPISRAQNIDRPGGN